MRRARPPRVAPLRYRAARRADVDAIAELASRAYRVSSIENRRDFYTDHPRFELRDVRVGELDGQLVASLVLYPFTAFVRGRGVPVAGIGSVAVSPEHRRRGVAESLMRSTLRELRQRGRALAALYAWRASYYRKLGFGVIELVHQLAVSPANLPASEETQRVRRLMLTDRPGMQALYERVASQGHFALARRPEWWSHRLWTYPGDWVVYKGRRGQLEGYLYYEVDSSHGPFRLGVTLIEFVAASAEAHRGLVGYLAGLADQVQEIHYAAPGDNAWLAVVQTAQNLRPGSEIGIFTDTGNVANGALLRFTDVKAGLESLPVSPGARGEIVLEVEDAVLPMNAHHYRVSARDGWLTVRVLTTTAGARLKLPRLIAPAEPLASIAAGTLPPMRAAEAGFVESSGGAAEIVEPWFRARPAFFYQLNAF